MTVTSRFVCGGLGLCSWHGRQPAVVSISTTTSSQLHSEQLSSLALQHMKKCQSRSTTPIACRRSLKLGTEDDDVRQIKRTAICTSTPGGKVDDETDPMEKLLYILMESLYMAP